jgi:cysteine synthase
VELDVDDFQALQATRLLIRLGYRVGPSSGLNYLAAVEAAQRLGPAARILTVFPDGMEKYFSTGLVETQTDLPGERA